MQSNIVDVTLENFEEIFIKRSASQLVLVDFWASWCAPCKVLTPTLEALANQYQGQFLLAKVDCETQEQIAAQFGIQNMPTVVFVKDGQPVDGFTGNQTQSFIVEKLEQHLPKQWELMVNEASNFVANQDWPNAINLLGQAYQQSEQQYSVAIQYAFCLIEGGYAKEALTVLEATKFIDQDEQFQNLKAKAELALEAQDSPEIQQLEQAVIEEPENVELKRQLAAQYSAIKRFEEALQLLLEVLRKDIGDADTKKLFLDLLTQADKTVAATYQRKFYNLLY